MQGVLLKEKRIIDLVGENYVRASVLFYFGIKFYEYNNQTLEEVCRQKGLKVEQVVNELESAVQSNQEDIPLAHYPLDIIIEYLKHAHFTFIKHKLPYISKLIEGLSVADAQFENLVRDLKLVFPLFVEDFIHHIYEEEDTLFKYIIKLELAAKQKLNPVKLWRQLEAHSLQQFALEHELHEDEMAGIRKITLNFELYDTTPLHVKVIYAELMDFEKQLITHAAIENNILFPRAMSLEAQVKERLFSKSRWN
ncbi:MAG TPA: iron-sulfur cluster repair di-iron protein [Cyclobacteriaceae bacterium]|nr:iron-sulfur cluster repair di-iron protein [Cyclobacteriaceae bacterium]